MYDSIIIGTGPAGITASIYAKRSNLNVLVIGKSSSALEKVKKIDNYYGMHHISGNDLYQKGIEQAKDLEIDIVNDEVLNIKLEYRDSPFFKLDSINNTYETKTVILATGMVRNLPQIANIKLYQDKNISFCAICDGFFYRNKSVCVLGYNDYAIEEAEELLKVTSNVTILTNGVKPSFTKETKVAINSEKIIAFKGDEFLDEVELENSSLRINGLFIAWGIPGGMEFAKKLGLEMENNSIVTSNKMETNIPGIYACGDMTGLPYQIHKATYEGMIAGLSVSKFIKEN